MDPTKKKALARLGELRTEADSIDYSWNNTEKLKEWKLGVESALSRLFDSSSRYLKEFDNVSWSPGLVYSGMPEGQWQESFLRGAAESRAILTAAIREAEDYHDESISQPTEVATLSLTLTPPESVTLSWLYQHVPARLWVSAAGVLAATFLGGVTISQVPFARHLIATYLQPVGGEATSDADIDRVIDARSKDLIAGHNARVADLQKAIAAEEHAYGISPGYGHKEAVQRLRDDLKAEHERYEQELQGIRRLKDVGR